MLKPFSTSVHVISPSWMRSVNGSKIKGGDVVTVVSRALVVTGSSAVVVVVVVVLLVVVVVKCAPKQLPF